MDGNRPWFGTPGVPTRRLRPIAAAVIGVIVLGSPASAATHHGEREGVARALAADTAVAQWDATATQAFGGAGLTPAEGHTIFAYVGIAVYDAVMSIHHTYEPFAVHLDAPADASAEAAVAAAAHDVLAHYLPGQIPMLDAAYAAALDAIADGDSESDGVAIGRQVAAELIAARADDGFRAPVTYTPPNPPIPGVWLPTATSPPIGTYLGRMRPFALRSADQFRPDGPPSLTSRDWARDYAEVKEIGSSASTSRTPYQTLAARFWAEPPVQQARGSFRRFVLQHGLDIVEASRFLAMVSVVYADALIACFDAKYHFAFWRPITAIRAGDTDGNPNTIGDASWSPMLPATPNHPEYPSAHSCITPAGGMVIARYLGTDEIDFTIPSLTGLGDRRFDTVRDLETEVTNARIWGGIHYRTSVRDGTRIGKRTANFILARYFKPAGD